MKSLLSKVPKGLSKHLSATMPSATKAMSDFLVGLGTNPIITRMRISSPESAALLDSLPQDFQECSGGAFVPFTSHEKTIRTSILPVPKSGP